MLGACKPGLSPVRVNPLGGDDVESQPDKPNTLANDVANPIFNAFLRFIAHQK